MCQDLAEVKSEDEKFSTGATGLGCQPPPPKRPKPLDEMTDDNWDNFYKDHDKSWHVLINQTTWLIDKWLQKYLLDLDDYLGVLLDCKRLIDQVCFKLC